MKLYDWSEFRLNRGKRIDKMPFKTEMIRELIKDLQELYLKGDEYTMEIKGTLSSLVNILDIYLVKVTDKKEIMDLTKNVLDTASKMKW